MDTNVERGIFTIILCSIQKLSPLAAIGGALGLIKAVQEYVKIVQTIVSEQGGITVIIMFDALLAAFPDNGSTDKESIHAIVNELNRIIRDGHLLVAGSSRPIGIKACISSGMCTIYREKGIVTKIVGDPVSRTEAITTMTSTISRGIVVDTTATQFCDGFRLERIGEELFLLCE